MQQITSTIRNYDPVSDSCSVELTAIGAIETWIEGVKIAAGVDRANLIYGASAVLVMPDVHRLCEAQITSVLPPAGSVTAGGSPPNPKLTQTGRVNVFLDNLGHNVSVVTYPFAFSGDPDTLTVTPDLYDTFDVTVALSAIGNATFTVSTATSLPQPNRFVAWSWSAVGNS